MRCLLPAALAYSILPAAGDVEPSNIKEEEPSGATMQNETNVKQNADDWTPDWAKRVVWYQIFPERFRNGDPTNDPTLEDTRGSWPHDMDSPWRIHPWTSDWYARQPWERDDKPIWHHLQRRRYGGDLQGIIDKLDYLQELGITAIYLNPVFDAPSLHKYDGATYHHIDANFGPDPAGDRKLMAEENPADPQQWVWTAADRLMLKLIGEAHARDMRIIFDGVFNHMGMTSWPFRDVVENQRASPYRDWFAIKSWDDPEKGTRFDYEGWFGVRELPELREDENGIVAGPRDYIFAATRRWMDPDGDGNPADGIDGWRLDVAFCVKHPFWKDWRRHVKSINPEAYLTAEVVEPIPELEPYLRGDEFDAMMNYNFAFACSEFFIDPENSITASEFDAKLRRLREAFGPSVAYVQQNLYDSHDSARIGSQIVNSNIGPYRQWEKYFGWSKAEYNPHFLTRKPNAEELRIQKLIAVMQMTYVGAPMIYYGDEVGMWGGNDPCSRKPMVWEDLEYEPERREPDGRLRAEPDEVSVNRDLLKHYRRLIRIRNENEALQTGDFATLLTDDARGIYAFRRALADDAIVVVLNNSGSLRSVMLQRVGSGAYRDLLDNERTYETGEGELSVSLEPYRAAILEKQ